MALFRTGLVLGWAQGTGDVQHGVLAVFLNIALELQCHWRKQELWDAD